MLHRRVTSRTALLIILAATTLAATTSISPAATSSQARRDGDSLLEIYPPPSLTAAGWLVADGTTGEPMAGIESSTPRPIASLTKLMTALIVLEDVNLDELVTIPTSVTKLPADAATMRARPGERWTAGDLLRAMLAHSANDAAIALAAHAGGGSVDAFVDRMNERARELEMNDSDFRSPTGLDAPGHVSTSTPGDLIALAAEVLTHPEARSAVSARSVRLTRSDGEIRLPNRNPLLGTYPGVDGVKTGFTDSARYMLISHHVDPRTRGELLVATFASSSERTRISDQRALLDWARPLWSSELIVEGGTPIVAVPIIDDDARLKLFACDDLAATVRVGERLTPIITAPRSVSAPVMAGDVIGELRFVRSGADTTDETNRDVVGRVQLCAQSAVPRRTRLERLRDHALDWHVAWRAGSSEIDHLWNLLQERVP